MGAVTAVGIAGLASCAKDAPQLPQTLTVSRVFVVLPAGDSPAALYATFTNPTVAADTLRSVELSTATVMLHGAMPDMAMLDALPVASGATERLAPGGRHGMITGFGPHARGDSLSLRFHFAVVGTIAVKARVIAYADVDTAAPPAR